MRDSFLKLLSGERPDEAVWTGDLTYWVDGRCHAGAGDPYWQTEQGHLEFCRDLGVMPYFWYGKSMAATPVYDGVDVVESEQGNCRQSVWTTPAGDLCSRAMFVDGSSSEAPTRYAVNSVEDMKVFLCVLEHRRLEPTNLTDYRQRLDQWASYDGVPLLGLPRSPLPAFITEWAGVQNATYLMADRPDLVCQALELLEEQESPIIDAVCELAPPVVHFPDNLSSENLTSFFDEHMAERYRRRLERLHAAGTACVVHLDGTVAGLLPGLAAIGFDAVEALTPAPVGDVSLQDMRQAAGRDDLVLWGGVPGAMFAPPFDWDQMQLHVTDLLAAWQGEPFIVSTADQVPPDGDITMCRRIAQMLAAA